MPREPLPEYLLWYWHAYADVRSEAPVGAMGGVGDIPYLKIQEYLDRRGVTDETEREFAADVLRLAHLRVMAEANKTETKGSSG